LHSLPKVTIGTSCYNTGKYVIKSLETVKNQDYPNIEHIIIDDCSQDDSVKIVKDWIEQNNYKCTFIEHKKNTGVHQLVNEILEKSTGKYISFVSDDIWIPGKITEQVKILEEAGDEYGVVYGNMDYIDANGNSLGDNNWFEEKFYKGFPLPQGNIFKNITYSVTFFCQASLYNLHKLKQLGFRFDDRFISEDWHLNLFITRYAKAIGINKIYCHYRYRKDSMTATNWTDEKMHRVLSSQYKMLRAFYNHPLNSRADDAALYKTMHAMALQLYSSGKMNRMQKANIAFDLFRKQPSAKNIAKWASLLLLGNLDIAKKMSTNQVTQSIS